jgi:hypothetical protein
MQGQQLNALTTSNEDWEMVLARSRDYEDKTRAQLYAPGGAWTESVPVEEGLHFGP